MENVESVPRRRVGWAGLDRRPGQHYPGLIVPVVYTANRYTNSSFRIRWSLCLSLRLSMSKDRMTMESTAVASIGELKSSADQMWGHGVRRFFAPEEFCGLG